MADTKLFQYCQKLVVLSEDKTKVLLAKRQGEEDYDGTFTFIGGKMETTDSSILAGMKREKDEEVGPAVRLAVLPDETKSVLYRKKDGHSMILPHIAGLYKSGEISINEEYSEYRWVEIDKLEAFEPKVQNIPEMTAWAVARLAEPGIKLVEI